MKCRCGADVPPHTQEEIDHFVWALRPDGTRSNLGTCPIKNGSVQAAKNKLIREGYSWYGGEAGFEYKGQRV